MSWEEEPTASSDSGEPQEPCYSSDEDSREFGVRQPIDLFQQQAGPPKDLRPRSPDSCAPDAAGRGRLSISWTGALEARFLKALQQAGGVWVSVPKMWPRLVHALRFQACGPTWQTIADLRLSGERDPHRGPGQRPARSRLICSIWLQGFFVLATLPAQFNQFVGTTNIRCPASAAVQPAPHCG